MAQLKHHKTTPHGPTVQAAMILGYLHPDTLDYLTNLKVRRSSGRVSWVRHESIGQGPRQEHSVTSIENDVYIIGGVAYDETSVPATLNRVEYYNTVDQSWHVAAPLPMPLNHGNSATVDGRIYVLGSLMNDELDWVATNNSYVYQPYNDTWAE